MKIHGVKLDKKNFWIPLIITSVLSFLIYFFGGNYIIYSTFKILSGGNVEPYSTLIFISLFTLPITIFITSLPPFFIIRRLLSKKPKKVFYFELPILMIIYSLIYSINQFIGFMFVGPMLEEGQFVTLLLPPIFFIIFWLSLLTISLYFYYKKNNFFKK